MSKPKITERKALQILISHTSQNIQGSGCGIRSLPSKLERAKAIEAIEKLWLKAYKLPLIKADRFNLGLSEDN